jgi:hypothetical protein
VLFVQLVGHAFEYAHTLFALLHYKFVKVFHLIGGLVLRLTREHIRLKVNRVNVLTLTELTHYCLCTVHEVSMSGNLLILPHLHEVVNRNQSLTGI